MILGWEGTGSKVKMGVRKHSEMSGGWGGMGYGGKVGVRDEIRNKGEDESVRELEGR